jgi:hypothetical protein
MQRCYGFIFWAIVGAAVIASVGADAVEALVGA